MNNEEKILAMLGELCKGQAEMRSDIAELKDTQAKQGEQLAKHGEQLAKQGEQLAKQGERLDKQSERLDEMQNTLTRVAVTQEAQVLPQIQLLFEGHSVLNRKLDSMATKEQVAELADHVEVIKSVVTQHSADIRELQCAQ